MFKRFNPVIDALPLGIIIKTPDEQWEYVTTLPFEFPGLELGDDHLWSFKEASFKRLAMRMGKHPSLLEKIIKPEI